VLSVEITDDDFNISISKSKVTDGTSFMTDQNMKTRKICTFRLESIQHHIFK